MENELEQIGVVITLDTPKEVTIKAAQPAVTTPVSEFTILTIQDNCVDTVKAVVKVADVNRVIVLWENEAYDTIGDWTQTQANTRIIELL